MRDEILNAVVRELGLEDLDEQSRQAAVAAMGENVLAAVIVEILAILPKPKHQEFQAMIGTVSPLKMYNYLSPYITDIPALVERIARDEVAETKKLLAAG